MDQISSLGAYPDATGPLSSAAAKAGVANTAPISTGPATDETQASPLHSQLTRLSLVLNGLQQSASITRSQYSQALDSVRSGTYTVDSMSVSRSIINDLLNYPQSALG
jgi:hypothetical protein